MVPMVPTLICNESGNWAKPFPVNITKRKNSINLFIINYLISECADIGQDTYSAAEIKDIEGVGGGVNKYLIFDADLNFTL